MRLLVLFALAFTAFGQDGLAPDSGVTCREGATKTDDCNTCSCSNGQWMCTLRACVNDCKEGDTKMEDCNECVCGANGMWGCTDMACPPALQLGDVCYRFCEKPDPSKPFVNRREDCPAGTKCQKDASDTIGIGFDSCNSPETCVAVDETKCMDGETKKVECNTCTCTNGVWACTEMACKLELGDICYRFCEDNSLPFISRRGDCPVGSECKQDDSNADLVSFDSCKAPFTCMDASVKGDCEVNGVIYKDGDSFYDECNECKCTGGAAACTRKGCVCEPPQTWQKGECVCGAAPCADNKICVHKQYFLLPSCEEPPVDECANVRCANPVCEKGEKRELGPDGCCYVCVKPPPTCDPVTCRMFCEFGFVTDSDGCPTCECNPSPCALVRCAQGTVCKVDPKDRQAKCVPVCGEGISRDSTCPNCVPYDKAKMACQEKLGDNMQWTPAGCLCQKKPIVRPVVTYSLKFTITLKARTLAQFSEKKARFLYALAQKLADRAGIEVAVEAEREAQGAVSITVKLSGLTAEEAKLVKALYLALTKPKTGYGEVDELTSELRLAMGEGDLTAEYSEATTEESTVDTPRDLGSAAVLYPSFLTLAAAVVALFF